MTVRPIRLFGDPVLTSVAEPVTTFDDSVRQLVTDLTDTMKANRGAGLAANQIGVLRRVFVYDCGGKIGHIINPVWERDDDTEQRGPEGCLSIPDVQEDTTRWMNVTVRGQNVDGEDISFSADEILARCIQHETDHLDGIMFLRRLDSAERKSAMSQIRSSEWFGA